jgi:hypothetical protein
MLTTDPLAPFRSADLAGQRRACVIRAYKERWDGAAAAFEAAGPAALPNSPLAKRADALRVHACWRAMAWAALLDFEADLAWRCWQEARRLKAAMQGARA